MRVRLALAALAAALAALAVAAPSAPAAVSWAACPTAGFQCGTLAVPLDHAGVVPGTVTLSAQRVVASANPTATAVVALAGGPGQAALPAATDFASILAPALGDRDLLVYDQRGTGRSDRLRCAAFDGAGAGSVLSNVRACADELGPARGFFRSADSVADLEDLRREAGYEKLFLFGVSYGTKVALDYAAAYPDRTAGLVLDSVVPQEGSDVFNRTTFAAIPRVLRTLCANGACRGITTTPTADLSALVRRAARSTLRGRVVLPSGTDVPITVDPLDLYGILLSGDLSPALRAGLPGAVRAALHRDLAPILRLSAKARGLNGVTGLGMARRQVVVDDAAADSDALFAATRCEESAFPWDRGAGAPARAREVTAAARLLPQSAFVPFTRDVALRTEVIPLCLGWPNASPPPAPPGPLPGVPALLLNGAADLRTPVEDARAVAAKLPGAQLVEVPATGHSVLGSDLGDCARNAVAAFFAGAPQGACRPGRVLAPTRTPPARLAAVAGSSAAQRTLNALRMTIADVSNEFTGDAVAVGHAPHPGSQEGGLRSGFARVTESGIRLTHVEFVPGVVVSGFIPSANGVSASFTVRGRQAATGTVRVSAGGRATGRLGGRRVTGRFGSARASSIAGATARRLWPRALPRSPAVRRIG